MEGVQLITNHKMSIIVTIGIILFYGIVRYLINRLIKEHAKRNEIMYGRVRYIQKLSHFILIIVFVSFVGASWEISIEGLSIFFASIFTVAGVSLFATWSVLSNLTSSVILFFFFPLRIGHKMKIIDGENSLEGTIIDISLFYIKIETEDKKIISYPNNLAIQKPIIHSKGDLEKNIFRNHEKIRKRILSA